MPLRQNYNNATDMHDEHPRIHNETNGVVEQVKADVATLSTAVGTASNAATAAQADIDGTQFRLGGNGMGVVQHGGNANVARPAAGLAYFIWVGSVQPSNAVNGDLWMNTAGT